MPDDDTAVVEPSAPAVSVSQHRARFRPTWEHGLVAVLGLLVLVVHDVGYLIGQPFWTDEAWVAVTTRFPLSDLLATTSSTPIGWSVLLRLVTVGGRQTSRLLPLAFAGAAVVIGYWFARRLAWQRRDTAILAGVLAAAAVLLVPAMLIRDDLKQYTADAAFALLVVAFDGPVGARPVAVGAGRPVLFGMGRHAVQPHGRLRRCLRVVGGLRRRAGAPGLAPVR